MSVELASGLTAAVGAAVLYGCAPVAQSVAASRTARGTGMGLALTLRLARQPIWLAGLGCDAVAFGLEAVAFSLAPATLVVPVTSCDMVVFVLLGRLVFGERPSVQAVRGAVAMGFGVALLALAFGPGAELGAPATNAQMISFLGVCVVTVALAAFVGNRVLRAGHRAGAAAVFSVAAGVSFGMATLATRQIGRTASPDQPWQLLTTPTPYVLAGCSIFAIAMMQRGLQTNPTLAYPIASVVSAFLPVVVGAALLGDDVPMNWERAAFVGALVLIAVGIALLGQERSIE